MASLGNKSSAGPIKMILLGDSGGGKTGALCSLAHAGYRLRILDTDNGVDIIRNLLSSEKSPYKKGSAENVDVITITEKMKNRAGLLVPAQAKAWDKCMGLFDRWKDEETDLGSPYQWGLDDILVVDSLSSLCNFAMNRVLSLNLRLGEQPFQSDWGEAQRMVEAFLQTIYDKAFPCNVIMICHIVYIGQQGEERGYANTLGKALSPRVGRYFNHALMAQGMKIHTKTKGLVDLKNTNPTTVLPYYDVQFGLAEYFKTIRGVGPQARGTPGTPSNLGQDQPTEGNPK